MHTAKELTILAVAKRGRPGSLMHLVLFLIMISCTPIWNEYPSWCLILGSCFLCIGAARSAIIHTIVNGGDVYKLGKWLRICIFTSALCWSGWVAWLPVRYGLEWPTIFAFMATVAVSSAGVTATAPDKGLRIAYLLASLLPLTVTTFISNIEHSWVMACVGLTWCLYQLASGEEQGNNFHRPLRENHQLKLAIDQILDSVELAAQGDFTGQTHKQVAKGGPTTDLAAGIEHMLGNLRGLVSSLQSLGITLNGSTLELASNVSLQRSTLQSQAVSCNEMAATFKEINATAQLLSQTAGKVCTEAVQLADGASSVQSQVCQVNEGLKEISSVSQRMTDRLDSMNRQLGSIYEVVATISTVAAQANILSLNAAIEAERAGTAGKGFGAIAREIRRLSDETLNSASRIESTVQNVISAGNETVSIVNDFLSWLQRQLNQGSAVGDRVNEFLGHVQELRHDFEAVSFNADAQADGARNATQALIDFNGLMQNTSRSIRETGSLIEKLSLVVSEVSTQTATFVVHS